MTNYGISTTTLWNFNNKITYHLFERRLRDWSSWERGTLSRHILSVNSVHLAPPVYTP